MKQIKLFHYRRSKLLNNFTSKIPTTIIEKGIGFINQRKISSNQTMLFTNCNAIHMFFMKSSIDVIFLDKEYKVISTHRAVKPYSLPLINVKAKHTLEAGLRFIDIHDIKINDKIKIERR